MKVGIVSGYFNPIHAGHIEYVNEAKRKSDMLVAIVNSDKQVKIKGSVPFMDEYHRILIVANLKAVDATTISQDSDGTVCETLRYLKGRYEKDDLTFFNSGDRVDENPDNAEQTICKLLNIKYAVLRLPKVYSSSKLIRDAASELLFRR